MLRRKEARGDTHYYLLRETQMYGWSLNVSLQMLYVTAARPMPAPYSCDRNDPFHVVQCLIIRLSRTDALEVLPSFYLIFQWQKNTFSCQTCCAVQKAGSHLRTHGGIAVAWLSYIYLILFVGKMLLSAKAWHVLVLFIWNELCNGATCKKKNMLSEGSQQTTERKNTIEKSIRRKVRQQYGDIYGLSNMLHSYVDPTVTQVVVVIL